MAGLPFWLVVGLGSLLGLGLVATVLGIINIVRLTEIHRLVHENSAAQREEITGLQRKLVAALHTIGLRDQALELLRAMPDAPKAPSDAADAVHPVR